MCDIFDQEKKYSAGGSEYLPEDDTPARIAKGFNPEHVQSATLDRVTPNAESLRLERITKKAVFKTANSSLAFWYAAAFMVPGPTEPPPVFRRPLRPPVSSYHDQPRRRR
jgi:hypothetical protein